MPDALTLEVLGTFPHQNVARMHAPNEEPNYETLAPALVQLNANAASIATTGGDGILGHLVLTIGTVAYQTRSVGGVNHPAPAVPPAAPIFPAGATGAVISETRRTFDDTIRTYRLYHAVDNVLKQQVINACDDMYLSTLKDRTTGYAQVTCRQMITHLLDQYGRITPDALIENEEHMCTEWDAATPIERLFTQIDDGQAFAGHGPGNSAYTDSQLVRMGYKLIAKNAIMATACDDWRERPIATQTWPLFKAFFKSKHRDLKNRPTAASAGFQANFAEDVTTAMASLQANTDSTNVHMANMAEANLLTAQQVSTFMTSLTAMQAQLKALTDKANSNHNNNNSGRPPRSTTRPPDGGGAARTNPDGTKCYCWSHGGRVSVDHNSMTCQNKKPGHKDEATFDNRMGGSNYHCN